MLIERFKEHLNKKFKFLPDSREVMDFREELLGNLMSRAMELRENKALSDDEIYQLCIDSLGDYSDRLKRMSANPAHVLRDKRLLRDMLFALTLSLISIIVYVAVSYATGLWGRVAIIVFPSAAGVVFFYITLKLIIRNTVVNRHFTTGLILSSYAVLITLVAFFVTAYATPVGPCKAWVLVTFIPFFVTAASALNQAFFRRKKIPTSTIIMGSMWFFVAAYLLVAIITGIWHPTWLIVLLGPISALIIGIVQISKRIENK